MGPVQGISVINILVFTWNPIGILSELQTWRSVGANLFMALSTHFVCPWKQENYTRQNGNDPWNIQMAAGMCMTWGGSGLVALIWTWRVPQRFLVRSRAPPELLSKSPWSRLWTPSCSWWAAWCLAWYECVWMGECHSDCDVILIVM